MRHFSPLFIRRQFYSLKNRVNNNKNLFPAYFFGQKTFSTCHCCHSFNAKNAIFQKNPVYLSKIKISKIGGRTFSTASSHSPVVSTESSDSTSIDFSDVALSGDKKLVDVLHQIVGEEIKDRSLSNEECALLRKLSLDALTHGDKSVCAVAGIERTIDSRIFKSLLQDSKILLGVSYVKYLAQNDLFNPASTRMAAEILYKACRSGQVEKSYLLHFLDNVLLKKFDRFVSFTPILMLFCLCPTTRWREGVKMIKENSQLSSSADAHYLAAVGCFDNDEPSEGFTLLADFLPKNLNAPPFGENLHSAIINLISRTSKINFDESMNFFMQYIKVMHDSRSLGIPVQFESDVKSIFESFEPKWNVKNAQITPKGKCTCCDRQIENDALSSDEFSIMQSNLFDQLLKGEDVCRQSTPRELKEFQKFVETNKPFDVVLDGLNVAMVGIGRKQGPQEKAERLLNLVTNLKSRLQFKNVCVVARHHLFYNSPRHLKAILKLAKVFSLNDGSVDDPFILYASLASGKNCFVVSRDTFGFLNDTFDPYVRSLFQRWKRTNVIGQFNDPNLKNIIVRFPPRHKIVCQFSDGVFHLPLIRHAKVKLEDADFMPTSWLCVQKNGDVS